MAEKTEQATPKKMRDARKKGQVAKAQDFPSAMTFITSTAAVVLASGYIFEQLSGYIIGTFRQATNNPDLPNRAGGFMIGAMQVILNCSLPVLIVTVCVGLLSSFLVIGPVFSMEAMKPDLKRLNPVTNLKNLFKFKTLFELLKSILKITGAVLLIYTAIWDSLTDIIATAALPVPMTAQVFSDYLIRVMVRVGLFFLAIAIFDLIYQKRHFKNEMKMEKFEVKQEYRDTEGDPHLKGRRRETAREISYQEGIGGVRRARALITNPTHLAIAIEYDETNQHAPKIIVMGQDFMAEKMIQVATESGVPIMRNVPLARTLFEKGKIGDYVPEETYQAIAEILRWLEALERPEAEIFNPPQS